MKIAFNFLVLLVLVGCNKFEHKNPTIPANCELCPMAESLEGTYRGECQSYNFFTYSYNYDSLTINVSQIFLNNNQLDDSTSIYFSLATEYDSIPGSIVYDTITIRDDTGNVWYHDKNEYWIRNNSIYYLKKYTGWGGGSQYTLYEGLFLKQ
jgi:hypothetical protein